MGVEKRWEKGRGRRKGGKRERARNFSTFKVYILSLIILMPLGLIPHLTDKEIGDSETLNVSPKLTESPEKPDLELKSISFVQFQFCASASKT